MDAADSTITDGELIAASATDPALFAAVYDRHSAEIHRFVTRRLGTGMADDVTAEVFLAAFSTRSRFDTGRASARPWLYGIAVNRIGKFRRSEARALRAIARSGPDDVTRSWVEEADERLTAHAANRALAGALAGLPTRDRHVLLLVAWADLTYQEVADALAIPIGTVRSRLNRARRHVRQQLEAEPRPAVSTGPAKEALRHG